MPTDQASIDNVRDWPVKVLRGTFSETKKAKLWGRYARRRIRVEFRAA